MEATLVEFLKQGATKILIKILDQLINGIHGTDVLCNRVVYWEVHGRFHSLKEPWVYDGLATDRETGISAKAKHYKSAKGAMKHALEQLGTKLKNAGLLQA